MPIRPTARLLARPARPLWARSLWAWPLLAIGAMCAIATIPAAAAPLSDSDVKVWQRALDAAARGHADKARRIAATASDGTLEPVIDWLDFRRDDSNADFVAIADFVENHPDWPYIETLRGNAEHKLIDGSADRDAAQSWLERHPPVSGDGALAWFRAMKHLGDHPGANDKHAAAIARDWVKLNFSPEAEGKFYKEFRQYLSKDDNLARLDRLIWERQVWPARRMLPRVDADHAALAAARLALLQHSPGVDRAVARVPDRLRNAPSLWYERLRWRRQAGHDDSARTVLLDPPAPLAALPRLPRPGRWAQEGQILARRALNDGLITDAYRLAATHGLDSGLEFAQSEFLAGWIGLSQLHDDHAALDHFTRLFDNVRYPISRARGAFWAGEAAAASGEPKAAEGWYERAGKYPTTYYGQAALAALGMPMPRLHLDAEPSADARAAFERRDIVATVRQLGQLDRPDIVRPFLIKMIYASDDADQMMLVAELALAAGQPLEGLRAAKRAYREDGALSAFAYPMIKLPVPPGNSAAPDRALLLALIRQESGFDRRAISGSGARGMMQLLPATAHRIARKLGLPYSKRRLTEDPTYNIEIGTAYFADLLERFNGVPALALAGYNGGPRNVDRWIATYGDPRKGEIALNDWIESIPYSETRNYVQRILEAVPVYRQLLGDPQVAAVTIPLL